MTYRTALYIMLLVRKRSRREKFLGIVQTYSRYKTRLQIDAHILGVGDSFDLIESLGTEVILKEERVPTAL